VKALKTQIEEHPDKTDKDAFALEDQLRQNLMEARKSCEDSIRVETEKLEGALMELTKTKQNYEEMVLKDWQKWMELRNDIADSNLRVMQGLDQATGPRASPTLARATAMSRRGASRGLPRI
jgi:hypothetical protein